MDTQPAGEHSSVRKISDEHYLLPCSVCGRAAVVIQKGAGAALDGDGSILYLLYKGIVHQPLPGLNARHCEHIFRLLAEGDLARLHEYLKHADVRMEEGLDAYCPECDAIYCATHYNASQEFEDGFYDCTMGTCPRGHQRMLDD